MRKPIILFAIFILIHCGKLSDSEDQLRAEKCGQAVHASSSGDSPPPWAVKFMRTPNEKDTDVFSVSATMISQRHALSTGFTAIIDNPSTREQSWHWMDNSRIDLKKNCKDDVIEIPKKLLKEYRISLSTCGDVNVCGTEITRKVVAGWYIGNCQLEMPVFGVTLLEISSNMPKDDYFRPVCMPAEKTPPVIDSEAEFHYIGSPDPNSQSDGSIIWSHAKTTKCNDTYRLNSMVCASHNTCPGQLGRALVQKINKRDTLMGISSFQAGCADGLGVDQAVSPAYYKEQICQLTGICHATVEPSLAMRSVSFSIVIWIVTLYIWNELS